MYFGYFIIVSPWKRVWPSFEQIWIPITQACFVLSLFKIGQVVQEKKILKFSQSFFCYYPALEKGYGPFI